MFSHPEGAQIPRRLRPVLPLLAVGASNDEIADALALSRHTVENYVSELKERIGARDRVHLVLAIRELLGQEPAKN